MFQKLDDLLMRYEDLTAELNNPSVVENQTRFRKLMKEQSDLTPLVDAYKHASRRYRTAWSFLTLRMMRNFARWRRKS